MNFFKIKGFHLYKTMSIIVFLFIGNYSFATNTFPPSYSSFLEEDCDACGCSSSGASLGMGGIIDNNFIGVRYLHQEYQSKDGIFSDSPKIDEYFNTIQVWSRIPIIKQLEAQVFIPYHFHSREYVNKATSIKGLGDISVLLNYTLIDKKVGGYIKKIDKVYSINHLLRLGGGVKLPTGSYDEAINNAVNPSFQLGTGSLDYIASLQYIFKYNSFGITNYTNYYIKTTNDKEYKFGNQFNFSSTLFYVFKNAENQTFVPSAGVSGEFYSKNQLYKLDVKNTDGSVVFSTIGVEYNTKNITVGTSAMYPINQKLAQGTIDVKFRSTLYLNYNF